MYQRWELKGLREQLEKVRYRQSLQVETYALDDLRLERQRGYARQMRRRRPARFQALAEPRRTLERVCFLRLTLRQTTDVVLSLADRLIQDLHTRATRDLRDAEWQGARTFRQALRAIGRVLSHHTIPDGALRRELLAFMPSEHVLFPSRAAAVRWQLCEAPWHIRPLLRALLCLAFEGEVDAPLLMALVRLRDLHARRGRQLPDHLHASGCPTLGGPHRRR
jgi:hypothetical protein